MTSEQASILIDYLETMEDKTNHQSNMLHMRSLGISEIELDAACRALGALAGRDYSIL